MKLRTYTVPIGSFLVALALAGLAGPTARLGARVPQSTTGSPDCDTTLEITDKDTYLPRGDESGDELKKGNAFNARIKWEVRNGPWDGTKRKFIVRFEGPLPLKGSCNNKGEKSLPDYVFEAGDNPVWKVEDGVPEYEGIQDRAMVTRDKYGPGEWVPIVVRSYDFGAWTKVVGSAEGCPEKEDRCPKDTDEDTLPDLWELGKRFFDDNGNILEYNIASKKTYNGEPDETSDRDGGFNPGGTDKVPQSAEPARVHDEMGDGFTAFEEYRGVFVQGKHYRMNELLNDGGPQASTSNRGTLMKNVFVHDPDEMIQKRSRVLPQHGVQFHRIKKDEMSVETADGKPAAGFVDDNSVNRGQRAIFLKADTDFPATYGYTPGFSINGDSRPVLVDKSRIQDDSKDIEYVVRYVLIRMDIRTRHLDFDDLLNFTVAHEFGHKMSLKHNDSELSNVPAAVPAYNNTVYWHETFPTGVRHWTLAELYIRQSSVFGDLLQFGQVRVRFNLLESISEEAGGETANQLVLYPEQLFETHDRQHLPATRLINFPGEGIVGALPFFPHQGTMMDARPEFNYLFKPLPANQRKNLKLK